MNNEVVLIRALNSVSYKDAKSAIKLFYRTALQDRTKLRESMPELLAEEGKEHNKFTDQQGRDWYVEKENKHPVSVEVAKSVASTESLAAIQCPKCADAMLKTKVCPACSAGRIGYKFKYACPCGFEFVTKDDA